MALGRLQLLFGTVCLIGIQPAITSQRPHIVFIMADDLGWNDVGFHGSNQVPTPNIDALAYSGIILNNYYVSAICTPSRSALMTGKHPIHTGMQHTVLFGAEPRGLPLTEKLLPQHLKELGYTTRIVGKWHLGSYRKEYTPLYRGFDSHLGFWTGRIDYFDHTSQENSVWGLDMRRNMDPAWDLHGQYCTDLFTKESVRLIKEHDQSKPLFLYLAHSAVHSGNPYNPLPAPDDTVAKFGNVSDYNRRRFAGMLSKLDESVGQVVAALKNRGMLENSIVIFSTDNGGPAAGFNFNAASNWPLRGVKNTLWEGGVRGAGLIFSPLISKSSRVASQLMHVSDWLPTLYGAAGGNVSCLGNIDGLDLWEALSEDLTSERMDVLHNIDDVYGNAALTVGEWKIVKGSSYNGAWDSWYGPSGREGSYDASLIQVSPAGAALASMGNLPNEKQMLHLRDEADVKCPASETNSGNKCQPLKQPCLFNIVKDPCEQRNLANVYPQILSHLLVELAKWNRTALPPGNLPLDPRGDPNYWDHTWTNFGDYTVINHQDSSRATRCAPLSVLLKLV